MVHRKSDSYFMVLYSLIEVMMALMVATVFTDTIHTMFNSINSNCSTICSTTVCSESLQQETVTLYHIGMVISNSDSVKSDSSN